MFLATLPMFPRDPVFRRKTASPALDAHRVEHQRFVAKVDEFRNDIAAGKGSSLPLLPFLKTG
jgi:hemerythrin